MRDKLLSGITATTNSILDIDKPDPAFAFLNQPSFAPII